MIQGDMSRIPCPPSLDAWTLSAPTFKLLWTLEDGPPDKVVDVAADDRFPLPFRDMARASVQRLTALCLGTPNNAEMLHKLQAVRTFHQLNDARTDCLSSLGRHVVQSAMAELRKHENILHGSDATDFIVTLSVPRSMQQEVRSLVEYFMRTLVACHAHDLDHSVGKTTSKVIQIFFESMQTELAKLKFTSLNGCDLIVAYAGM